MTKSYRRKSAPKDTFGWKVVGHRYTHLWWKFWHEEDIVVPHFQLEPLLAIPDDFHTPYEPRPIVRESHRYIRPLQYVIEETNLYPSQPRPVYNDSEHEDRA